MLTGRASPPTGGGLDGSGVGDAVGCGSTTVTEAVVVGFEYISPFSMYSVDTWLSSVPTGEPVAAALNVMVTCGVLERVAVYLHVSTCPTAVKLAAAGVLDCEPATYARPGGSVSVTLRLVMGTWEPPTSVFTSSVTVKVTSSPTSRFVRGLFDLVKVTVVADAFGIAVAASATTNVKRATTLIILLFFIFFSPLCYACPMLCLVEYKSLCE